MTDVQLKMDGIISISRDLHDYYTERGVKSILLPPLVDVQEDKWIARANVTSKEEIVLIDGFFEGIGFEGGAAALADRFYQRFVCGTRQACG